MIDNSKIKAILFDLDDTLLDNKTAEYRAISAFKNSFFQFDLVNETEFYNLWSKMSKEYFDKYVNGSLTFAEQRIERMKSIFLTFDSKLTKQEAEEKFDAYLKLYEDNWCVYEDTFYTLNELVKNFKLAIVTNGNSSQQREKLKRTKLDKYFSEVIISDEVGVSKPNEEIFRIATERLDIGFAECVFVGDRFETDIETPTKLGMKAIWIKRKNELRQHMYVVNQLSELLTII